MATPFPSSRHEAVNSSSFLVQLPLWPDSGEGNISSYDAKLSSSVGREHSSASPSTRVLGASPDLAVHSFSPACSIPAYELNGSELGQHTCVQSAPLKSNLAIAADNALVSNVSKCDMSGTAQTLDSLPLLENGGALGGGGSSAPLEWTGSEPPLVLNLPWFRKCTIPMALLSRHVMATGESGSGKTRSCIAPLLGPLLRYSLPSQSGEDKNLAVLLVDPKGELGGTLIPALVESERAGRVTRIGAGSNSGMGRLRFYEGLENLCVADKLAKLDQIAPASWRASDNNAYWTDQAKGLLRSFANVEASCRAHCGKSLLARVLIDFGIGVDLSKSSFFQRLQTVLNYACQESRRLKALHGILLRVGLEVGLANADCQFLSPYLATQDLIEQFNYVNMALMPLLQSVTSVEVTALIDFDLFSSANDSNYLSIYQMVENGKIILFSPASLAQESINLIGRVLKTLFFQAVFTRKDKERPVAYVCDEFHRFVTCDPESGEQNLLDRCRAYRCICILATQSVESIRYALTGQTSPDAAIGVMLNNIACKLFLRNSDPRTAELLQSLLPSPPNGGRHIIHVRPLTTLRPGEAYFLHADGTWGRKQAMLT
jgi:hypothetical protein